MKVKGGELRGRPPTANCKFLRLNIRSYFIDSPVNYPNSCIFDVIFNCRLFPFLYRNVYTITVVDLGQAISFELEFSNNIHYSFYPATEFTCSYSLIWSFVRIFQRFISNDVKHNIISIRLIRNTN